MLSISFVCSWVIDVYIFLISGWWIRVESEYGGLYWFRIDFGFFECGGGSWVVGGGGGDKVVYKMEVMFVGDDKGKCGVGGDMGLRFFVKICCWVEN